MKATLEITIDPDHFPMRLHRMRQLGLNQHSCAEVLRDGSRRERHARLDAQPNSPDGVRYYYLLESGHLYEVQTPVQRGRQNHYYCMVTSTGDITHVSEKEVHTWLSAHTQP